MPETECLQLPGDGTENPDVQGFAPTVSLNFHPQTLTFLPQPDISYLKRLYYIHIFS